MQKAVIDAELREYWLKQRDDAYHRAVRTASQLSSKLEEEQAKNAVLQNKLDNLNQLFHSSHTAWLEQCEETLRWQRRVKALEQRLADIRSIVR